MILTEGNHLLSRMWSSRWKLLVYCLSPAAVIIVSYAIWRLKKAHRQQFTIEKTRQATSEEVVVPQSNPILDMSVVVAPTNASTDIAAASPSDSGYVEPCTPLPDTFKTSITSFSSILTPHPLPPTPIISNGHPSYRLTDATSIRGGRARASVQLPIEIVGRFIGRQGRNIKTLMSESGAQIHVQQKNITKDATVVPCIIQGTQDQISKALDLIMLRHPEVSFPPQFSSVSPFTLYPPNSNTSDNDKNPCSWDYALKPAIIPASSFLAIVTYIEKLNRVWLVPYSSTQLLEDLHQSMTHSYPKEEKSKDDEEKVIILEKYCAVRVSDVYWLRGLVMKESEEGLTYEVKLMDYGSSVIVPLSGIKPLRKEHTLLTMQAFPCVLANIEPLNSDSEDGMLVLQALVEGTVLEAHPIMSSDNKDVPIIELYIPSQYGSEGQAFINRELVNQGFAIWRENSSTPVPATSMSTELPLPSLALIEENVPININTTATPTPIEKETALPLPLSEILTLNKSDEELAEKIHSEISLPPEPLRSLFCNITTTTTGGPSTPPLSSSE